MAVTTASPAETYAAPDPMGVFFVPETVGDTPTVDVFDLGLPPTVLEPATVQAIMYYNRHQLSDTFRSLVDFMEVDAALGNLQSVVADDIQAADIGTIRYDKRQGFLRAASTFVGHIATEIGAGNQAQIGQVAYQPEANGLVSINPVAESERVAFGHYEPTDKDVKEGVSRADNGQWLHLLHSMKLESLKPFEHRQENFGVVNKLWKLY